MISSKIIDLLLKNARPEIRAKESEMNENNICSLILRFRKAHLTESSSSLKRGISRVSLSMSLYPVEKPMYSRVEMLFAESAATSFS